jgi:hypothetical protein
VVWESWVRRLSASPNTLGWRDGSCGLQRDLSRWEPSTEEHGGRANLPICHTSKSAKREVSPDPSIRLLHGVTAKSPCVTEKINSNVFVKALCNSFRRGLPFVDSACVTRIALGGDEYGSQWADALHGSEG